MVQKLKLHREANDEKKKIKDAIHRESDVRKYFQANVSCQLNFNNTEFSTTGASSKYLDEYHLEEERSLLGMGGYAEVRRGRHKKTGHMVALKIYDKYKLIDV